MLHYITFIAGIFNNKLYKHYENNSGENIDKSLCKKRYHIELNVKFLLISLVYNLRHTNSIDNYMILSSLSFTQLFCGYYSGFLLRYIVGKIYMILRLIKTQSI